jgi:hypothetical protein
MRVEWRAALPEVERKQFAIGGRTVGKLAQRGDLVVFGRHFGRQKQRNEHGVAGARGRDDLIGEHDWATQREAASEQNRGFPGLAIIGA